MTGWSAAVAGLVALAVAAAATPLAMTVAGRLGVLDRPGPLKPQTAAVPYLGGVAVALGITGAVVAGGRPLLLAPLGGALLLGLADDLRPLPVRARLVVEAGIGVAAAIVAGAPGPLGIALAAGLVVLLLNAVNLVDGMDGLAASITLLSAVGAAVVLGTGGWRLLAAAVAGGCAGFLLHNRPPARVYLGDAGSYLLGCALAMLAVRALVLRGTPLTVSTSVALAAVGALALVAYPLGEVATTVVRRISLRRSLFAGDRDHVYDRLRLAGCSTPLTLGVLASAQAACVTAGVLLLRLPRR